MGYYGGINAEKRGIMVELWGVMGVMLKLRRFTENDGKLWMSFLVLLVVVCSFFVHP